MLAKILFRREDVGRAREIAERISAGSTDPKLKAEAANILNAVVEYMQISSASARPMRMNITFGERHDLVILKRSWLTQSDVARIDQERVNNNFNRIILRPVAGEQQFVGRIEKIECSGQTIIYRIRPNGGAVLTLTSAEFSSVRMTVAKEGENTFQIGCDISLSNELAVMNYVPALVAAGNTLPAGVLTAISFVPDTFRLKTIGEMNAARPVAIDDDTARRSGPRVEVSKETIYRSISQSLRKLQKDEQRVLGSVEKIECSTDGFIFTVSSGDRSFRLSQQIGSPPEVRWFTVASSQLPLACGSGPLASPTLVTFVPPAQQGAFSGVIRAIEFVPDGFVP